MTLDRVLYLVHLSTFAYLSGLFVRRSVERDGARQMVLRRTTLMVWLYLLWTVIQGSTRVAASSVSNIAITVGDVLRIWVPEGQLWFLPWLIAVTVVAMVTRPWRGGVSGGVVAGCGQRPGGGRVGLRAHVRVHPRLGAAPPVLDRLRRDQSRHAALARQLVPVTGAAVVGTGIWLWIALVTAGDHADLGWGRADDRDGRSGNVRLPGGHGRGPRLGGPAQSFARSGSADCCRSAVARDIPRAHRGHGRYADRAGDARGDRCMGARDRRDDARTHCPDRRRRDGGPVGVDLAIWTTATSTVGVLDQTLDRRSERASSRRRERLSSIRRRSATIGHARVGADGPTGMKVRVAWL